MNTANPAELSREDVERIQAIIRRFISSPDHESMWFNPEDTKIVIHALRATMRYLTIRDGNVVACYTVPPDDNQPGVRISGTFEHHCTCGGYAWRMNGRDPRQPHMSWCPQADEYAEYVRKFGVPDGHIPPPVDVPWLAVGTVLQPLPKPEGGT